MTSFRQIEANRRNAQHSTGPRTDEGKEQSRGNAIRHGLTAETVIGVLENPEDYKAFELAVTSDFDAPTAVERELVLRLASLLWRLRRSIAIESGLLQLQHEGSVDTTTTKNSRAPTKVTPLHSLVVASYQNVGCKDQPEAGRQLNSKYNNKIAQRFLYLAEFDYGAFKRLGRYETSLWRQVGQILSIIDALQWKPLRGQSWSASHWRKRTKGRPTERADE